MPNKAEKTSAKRKQQDAARQRQATQPQVESPVQTAAPALMMDGANIDVHALTPDAALYLQRTVGNQALNSMIQRDDTITFGDDEALQVESHRTNLGSADTRDAGPGAIGDFIDNKIVNVAEEGWDLRINNFREALHEFTNYMQFPADKEAKADLLKAAVDYGVEQTLGAAAGAADKAIGLPVASKTVGLVQALKKESDRAAAAASMIKVRDFISSIRENIADDDATFSLGKEALRAQIETEFSRIKREEMAEMEELGIEGESTATPIASEAGDIAITGACAEYLNSMESEATEWLNSAPSMMDFLQNIVEGWVMGDSDTLNSEFLSMYFGGQIYIRIHVEVGEDGTSYSIDDYPDKGQLACGEADHAVSALNRLMSEENSSVSNINDLNIKKNLTVLIEVEKAWYESNERYHYHRHFFSPDDITHESDFPTSGSADNLEPLWAMVEDRVGPEAMSRITELEAK